MSKDYIHTLRPTKQGLYNPANEHDACGLGFVANFKGKRSHSIVEDGMEMLENLEHRGAVGADKTVGDGAGILTNIPHIFFDHVLKKQKISLPKEGNYGVGVLFLPKKRKVAEACFQIVRKYLKKNRLKNIFTRKVPTNTKILSLVMKKSEPTIWQVFIKPINPNLKPQVLKTKLFVLGKQISNEIKKLSEKEPLYKNFYISSLSNSTIVYKGMLLSDLVREYFPDLSHKLYVSSFSLIHQRFSTNTFPSWNLAQPFRMVCHNGEINTVRGCFNLILLRLSPLRFKIFALSPK